MILIANIPICLNTDTRREAPPICLIGLDFTTGPAVWTVGSKFALEVQLVGNKLYS